MKMKKMLLAFLVSCACLIGAVSFAEEGGVDPSAPCQSLDWDVWKDRFQMQSDRIAQGNVDLLLIGDSITHGWDNDSGKRVRDYYYGDRNYVNFGIGGDQTGHVIWRLEHAPMDKIHPKAAMVLIGINNLWVVCNQDPALVARGTKTIVDKLESLYPDIKILVLFTFVTGKEGNDPTRCRVAQANAVLLDLLRGDPQVTVRDLNYLWLDEANGVRPELMADFVHPTEAGYKLWAAAVEPEISSFLGVEPKPAPEF